MLERFYKFAGSRLNVSITPCKRQDITTFLGKLKDMNII